MFARANSRVEIAQRQLGAAGSEFPGERWRALKIRKLLAMNESATSVTTSTSGSRSLKLSRWDEVGNRSGKVRKLRLVTVLALLIGAVGMGMAVPASAVTRSVSIQVLPTQSVSPGGTAKYPFVVRSRGAVGSVTISVSGEPAGASTVINSGGNGLYELLVSVPANAAPSLSTLVIRTRSRATSKSASVYLEVRAASAFPPVVTIPPPVVSAPTTVSPPTISMAFSIRADNPEVTVASGVTASFGISVDRSSGFAGELVFSATGFPAGVSANFAPNPTRGGTVLYATASRNVPDGRYAITIRAAADAQNVKFTSAVLNIQNVVDFALEVPPTTNIAVGGNASVLIGFRIVGSTAPTVALGVSGLPTGVSVSFVPNPTFGNSTLDFTAANNASPGAYAIVIVGFSGGISHTYPMTLSITGGTVGGFGLSVSPSSLSTGRGSTASFSLLLAPTGGFSADVSWTVSGLPAGPTVSISGTRPNYVVAINVPTATTPGTYVLIVTGTSGSLIASVSVTLVIV